MSYLEQGQVWRKSSASSESGDCVEVQLTQMVSMVRDSKNPGPELTTPEFAQLIGLVKANRFTPIA